MLVVSDKTSLLSLTRRKICEEYTNCLFRLNRFFFFFLACVHCILETIFGGFIWSSWWHIYYWTHKLSSSSCTLFLLYHTLYNSKGALIGVRRMLYWLSMSRMILEVKNVECDLNAKHNDTTPAACLKQATNFMQLAFSHFIKFIFFSS